MPVSTLDGEVRQELHEHFDADGNPAGSTLVTVPGWSDTDRTWALALLLYEAYRCPRGHDLTESTDYQWRWEALPPVVCLACVAVEAAAKRAQKDPDHRAMLHGLRKVPRPQPKKRRG